MALIRYWLLLVGAAAMEGFFLFLQRWFIISDSRRIEYEMRNDFYAHLQRLPVRCYQGQRTGDLMSRATNDLSSVRMLIGPAVMRLRLFADRRDWRVHHDAADRPDDGAPLADLRSDRRRLVQFFDRRGAEALKPLSSLNL